MIQPKFCDWSDTISGIDKFHVEVFYLQPDASNRLAETGGALTQQDVSPDLNDFRFTCTVSGVYSIQVTATDRAGNKARARKLFNYVKDARLNIDQNAPVYIDEAAPETGYKWINSLAGLRHSATGFYELTVVWVGRYQSDTRYAGAWQLAAVPWMIDGQRQCTVSNHCVDDIYEGLYGMRSINPVTNTTGIVEFGLAFDRDASNGGTGLDATNYTQYSPQTDRATIQLPELRNGETVVVWLKVVDLGGNTDSVRVVVGVDTSAPNISSDPTFAAKGIDEYTSR